MPETRSPSISLVLGSGAARGLAHIGVIRVLEEQGFEIKSIAGASMGALVGGVYAAGRLGDYEAWVRELKELDVVRLLDLSYGRQAGMFRGDAVMDALRELVGDHHIEDLPIPFTAVATDLEARREIWLEKGNLFDAIRASIAIPGIFTPYRFGKRTLVDGGLLNPVPIAPTLNDHTDLTVAVNVMARMRPNPLGPVHNPEPGEPPRGYRRHIESFIESLQGAMGLDGERTKRAERLSMFDVIVGSIETMQESISRFRLAANAPDILVEIPLNVCRLHEFYRAADIIQAGRHWAEDALVDWRERNGDQ